jgi:hypothetical protein
MSLNYAVFGSEKNAKSDFTQAGKTGCLFSFPLLRLNSIGESRVILKHW